MCIRDSSKPVRTAMGIGAGSTVAYLVVRGMLLAVPQDEHLEHLMAASMRALASAGLSVQDLLDELPAARERVYQQSYSAELRAEIDRQWREQHDADAPVRDE